jgi:hypothetical protein
MADFSKELKEQSKIIGIVVVIGLVVVLSISQLTYKGSKK